MEVQCEMVIDTWYGHDIGGKTVSAPGLSVLLHGCLYSYRGCWITSSEYH